jgi:hypothetical protein
LKANIVSVCKLKLVIVVCRNKSGGREEQKRHSEKNDGKTFFTTSQIGCIVECKANFHFICREYFGMLPLSRASNLTRVYK